MAQSGDRTTVLISIDGMRPDALAAADTPAIDRLIAGGAFTPQARTVMPSVTLPCHTSMMRGVDVPRHGITSNAFHPLARPVPSVFDLAHAAGKRTGFFFNWGELRDLADPGSCDVSYFVRDSYRPEGDIRVAQQAATHAAEEPFDLMFVYLGHTDECGHASGWMSAPYIDAIGNADRCVQMALEGVRSGGREPIVLLLSDHGGHGRSHGEDIPEDMTIPWLLSGPGIRRGYRINGAVRIFDTAPTIAALLGIAAAREWDGQPVREAFDSE